LLEPFVTVPLVPVIAGMAMNFMFQIHFISVYKFVYFNSFSACLCMVFISSSIATSVSVCVFSVLFLIMYNCSICLCFYLITVDAANVIGLLYSFGYRASSQLLLLMGDRNSVNHEKSWLSQKCRSTKY
jgi:hypothetical protein